MALKITMEIIYFRVSKFIKNIFSLCFIWNSCNEIYLSESWFLTIFTKTHMCIISFVDWLVLIFARVSRANVLKIRRVECFSYVSNDFRTMEKVFESRRYLVKITFSVRLLDVLPCNWKRQMTPVNYCTNPRAHSTNGWHLPMYLCVNWSKSTADELSKLFVQQNKFLTLLRVSLEWVPNLLRETDGVAPKLY